MKTGKSMCIEIQEDIFARIKPGIGGGKNKKMHGNAKKMVEKEIKKEMEQQNKPEKTNLKPNKKLQLYINGKKINVGNPNNPQNQKSAQKKPVKKQIRKIITKEFTSKMKEKFSSLPKEEPETTIRRLSNKIIYEINMPGVKKIENISIRNLEKSIEIRAISKDKAYYKIITVDLPLIKYNLEKNTLILELETKN